MAKITQIIPTQRFELIRDRIAQILALELANQAVLQSNTLFNGKVWVERFIRFDKTELPAINVYFSDASYDHNTAITARGTNTYNIDLHCSAKHENGSDGDKLSMFKLQKLAGVIRAILEDPAYIRLDFANGVIQHTSVSSLRVSEPSQEDSFLITSGRLVFTVLSNENTRDLQPIDASEYTTSVTIGETDKGFYFETINT